MYGKVICLAGELGAGKTSYIKKFAAKAKTKKTVCYLRISDDWNDGKVLTFTNFVEFIKYANTQTNTLFIIDEAFTCLPKKLNIKMNKPNDINNLLADFLVNCRKLNNFIFIIYHSLSQIPTEWLIPYLDYLVRFKTNDLMQYQVSRFKSFDTIVKSLLLDDTPQKYKYITLKLRK
jgi:hypothetical protein